MAKTNPKKVLKWLNTMPSLDELCRRYPDEWATVQRDVSRAVGRRRSMDRQKLRNARPTLATLLQDPKAEKRRTRMGPDSTLSRLIRRRMVQMAVENYGLIAASGIKRGVVRFNWLNGCIVKALLFSEGLERKPVSLFWFRLLWPFVWQRKRLMPLAVSKGIYCFYSKPLIEELSMLIGDKSCLEIGAGDGTLTRFLKNRGVRITATDNHSWRHSITYPDWVVRRNARGALKEYAPEVVICSWPPADNDFENQVFKTSSVQVYVVIASRYRFASGNWRIYAHQSTFDFEEDRALGWLVLPPELGAAVYVFRRKTAGSGMPLPRESVRRLPEPLDLAPLGKPIAEAGAQHGKTRRI